MRRLCSMLAGLLSLPALAQVSDLPPDLRALIDDLDHPSLMVREQAAEAITNDPSAGVVLDRLLSHPEEASSLSVEQRLRLRRAARERFFQRPLPGMGLSFSSDAGGIRVMTLVESPLFDAHKALEAGDLITHVEGEGVRTDDDLRAWIMSRDPGDVLRVTFRRQDETFHAPIRLGRYEDLDAARAVDSETLTAGWMIRSARYAAPSGAGPILDPGLDDWPEARASMDDESNPFQVALGGQALEVQVEGGVYSDSARGRARPTTRLAPVDPRETIIQRRMGHIQAMSGMRLALEGIEERLKSKLLAPDDVFLLRSQKATYEDRIRWYQEQIAACERELQRLR